MKKRRIIILVVIILALGSWWSWHYFQTSKPVATTAQNTGVVATATFNCADHKKIQAIFFPDRVELSLSDGRNLLLSQGVSASGARYVNADESLVFWNKGDTAFITEGDQTTYADCLTSQTQPASTTQMANPASVNCTKVGGTLVVNKRGDGGEYGLCYFDDNRACEEWALLRGDCPLGGRKTTGFDTIDQKYCAWLGGDTLAEPNSICTFKNGSQCTTIDLYQGTCSSS